MKGPKSGLKIKFDNILLDFGKKKTVENWKNILFWHFSTVFKKEAKCYLICIMRPDLEPIIKAHVLDPKIKTD